MPTPRQMMWLRFAALAALVVAAFLIGRATGLSDEISRDKLRAAVASAGAWGMPLYVGAFSLALLFHLPAGGILFVAVAVTLFGKVAGGVLAYAGSVVAVLVSFMVVRGVAGRPLTEIKNRWVRRALAQLESRPLLTVAALRVPFFAGAPLNYGLALAGVSLRDYLLGSLLGLIPPVIVLTALFDLLIG